MRFKEVKVGLYIFSNNNKTNSKQVSAYSYLNTVSAAMTNFTRRQVERRLCQDIQEKFRALKVQTILQTIGGKLLSKILHQSGRCQTSIIHIWDRYKKMQ